MEKLIKEIFASNKLDYDYTYNHNTQEVCISIFDGDWKHDHIRLMNIMEDNDFICTSRYVKKSDCDCYDGEYTFAKK